MATQLWRISVIIQYSVSCTTPSCSMPRLFTQSCTRKPSRFRNCSPKRLHALYCTCVHTDRLGLGDRLSPSVPLESKLGTSTQWIGRPHTRLHQFRLEQHCKHAGGLWLRWISCSQRAPTEQKSEEVGPNGMNIGKSGTFCTFGIAN